MVNISLPTYVLCFAELSAFFVTFLRSFSPVVRKLVQPMQVGFQIGSLLKFRSLIRLDSLVESLVALNDTISSRR